MGPESIRFVANVKGKEEVIEVSAINWETKQIMSNDSSYNFEEVECIFAYGGFKK